MSPPAIPPSQRLLVSPAEAAQLLGIGRSRLYEEITSGALRSFTLGRRRLIRIEAIHEWLERHAG